MGLRTHSHHAACPPTDFRSETAQEQALLPPTPRVMWERLKRPGLSQSPICTQRAQAWLHTGSRIQGFLSTTVSPLILQNPNLGGALGVLHVELNSHL